MKETGHQYSIKKVDEVDENLQLSATTLSCFSKQATQQIDRIPLYNTELRFKEQFQRQLLIRVLDEKEPHLQNVKLSGHRYLSLNRHDQQKYFDRQFAFSCLDQRQPQLTNISLHKHSILLDRQALRQQEYDKQAIFQDIRSKQPDIIAFKRREEQKIEKARQLAVDRDLTHPQPQQIIKIKSVEDDYTDKRVYQNDGVFPLENTHDFQDMNLVDEIEIPINYTQAKKELSSSNNYLKNKQEDVDIQCLDWQLKISQKFFPRKSQQIDMQEQKRNIVAVHNRSNSSFQKKSTLVGSDTQRSNEGRIHNRNPLIEYAKRIGPKRQPNKSII